MSASRKVTKRRWFLRPIPILATVSFAVVLSWYAFGKDGLWHSYQLRKTRSAQAEQLHQLELRKKQLSEYLAALKAGDEVALERAARDLKLAAPGETVYDIQVEPKK